MAVESGLKVNLEKDLHSIFHCRKIDSVASAMGNEPRNEITEYLLRESGKHFDPKVADLFLQMLQEGKI